VSTQAERRARASLFRSFTAFKHTTTTTTTTTTTIQLRSSTRFTGSGHRAARDQQLFCHVLRSSVSVVPSAGQEEVSVGSSARSSVGWRLAQVSSVWLWQSSARSNELQSFGARKPMRGGRSAWRRARNSSCDAGGCGPKVKMSAEVITHVGLVVWTWASMRYSPKSFFSLVHGSRENNTPLLVVQGSDGAEGDSARMGAAKCRGGRSLGYRGRLETRLHVLIDTETVLGDPLMVLS